jgi:nicotinate-nucleotide adenylyltransferase
MLAGVRRGILGGTFDPPHLAHLVAAEAAYRDLALDAVSFIPAGAPWQKAGRVVAAAGHRWEMSLRSVAGVDYLEADDREVRRDGWTYTIDTLGSFPERDDLVLILGADAAAGLPSWHRAADVLDRAEIAVMPRPGADRAAVEEAAGRVRWLDTPLLPVSGTMLRSMRREGRSIRFLVREEVYAYIEEHGLYAGR